VSDTWSTASGRAEIEAEIAAVGRTEDDDIDLARAALLLAALDRPRVPLQRYGDHLEEIAAAMAEQPADTLRRRVDVLRQVLFEDLGYAGDRATYDDLQNANLMRVIDRRRGLPVSLAILCLHALRSQGWPAEALRFPGHVLVRLSDPHGRLILDPFDGGRTLDPQALRSLAKAVGGPDAELTPDHVQAMSNRETLLRLQNNIKVRRLQTSDADGGLAALETMLRLSPGDWRLWREAAGLHLRCGNLHAAVMALEHVVDLADRPEDRSQAERARQAIHAKLN